MSYELYEIRTITLITAAAVCLLHCDLAQADLRVGTAAVNISPPAGTPMAGYYYARGSRA